MTADHIHVEHKFLHARTFVLGLKDALKILGLEQIYDLPNGVHVLPPRFEDGELKIDFVSDAPFQIGPMRSYITQEGAPLCHWQEGHDDGPD